MKSDAALLWDESFLWGLMTYHALRGLGLGFDLIQASDVREGRLGGYKALVVPGGWASNKLKALGEDGAEGIREFVSGGGAYVGICGGAGLATSSGIGLVEVSRKPLKDRVPSVAGQVRLTLGEHPLWDNLGAEPMFYIWWPSQFVLGDSSLKVLASFESAGPDCFSSDFSVDDMGATGWAKAERDYGINLDPAKMKGDPIVIQGQYGKGRVLLSLAHFDTPSSEAGGRVLNNLWDYLGLKRARPVRTRPWVLTPPVPVGNPLAGAALELHDFGLRNFLWFMRGPLPRWRRGVRGLEYFTLYRLILELAEVSGTGDAAGLGGVFGDFLRRAKALLALERSALMAGERLTFSETSEPRLRPMREELFGGAKSYGGHFKDILDKVDALLYSCLLNESSSTPGSAGPREVGGGARGFVHVYTGEGKGKTTASVGLALRARSRGLRVLYAQFMKSREGGETDALKAQGVEILKFTGVRSPLFHPETDMEELRAEARRALGELAGMMAGHDLVVADEFVTLLSRGLITEDEALGFVTGRPEGVELVLTGRGATEALKEAADLVTYMQALRHPYCKDVPAREGIEY